jgi:hypothetical protein
MAENALDLRDLKAKLKTFEHDEKIIRAWYRGFGERLNDRLVPAGLSLSLSLYALDVARGKSGFSSAPLPPELIGVDGTLVTVLEIDTWHTLAGLVPEDADLQAALRAMS